MRATLEFQLPEDEWDFDRARHGGEYALVIAGMYEKFRALIKYNDSLSEKERDLVESLRTHLTELMDERGLPQD